jgi:hypothetical protein
MSQHRGILSSPSSPQSLQSSKKRYVILQRSKSRIRYSPLSSLYPFIPTYIYHHHHLPLSPYTHSTHILRTTHMHILIWLYGWTHSSGSMVWLCNKCLQVCISCLPTYEHHISLLVIGWERRHNVTLPYTKNTTYLERREKAYTINALVRIHKYHKWETWEGYTKESLSFIWKSAKLWNNGWSKS